MDGSGGGRTLDRAEVEAFFTDGFVVVPDLFSPSEIEKLRACCDRLQAEAQQLGASALHHGSQFVLGRVTAGPLAGQVRIDRVVWAGAAEPHLLAVGEDPRLLRPVAQLLGGRAMDQLINQVHFKLPGDGVEFPWHQDSLHRRYGTPEWQDVNGRGSYVQTVLAIDDATLENGPLWFVRASCRHGHIPVGPDQVLPEVYVEQDQLVPVTLAAGSVAMFGPYTIHGSTANRSSQPRRLLINGYAAAGANHRTYPGQGSGRRLVAP